jgi:hypothetical protein
MIPYQGCIVHNLHDLLAKCGLRDQVYATSIVDDIIHHSAPVILNVALHHLARKPILGIFHQKVGLPIS